MGINHTNHENIGGCGSDPFDCGYNWASICRYGQAQNGYALAALKIVEIMEEHNLPPGVMNIVTGPGCSVGEALASHPYVNMVGFTGSCETGKAIMAAASKTAKRLFLELGYFRFPSLEVKDTSLTC